MPSRRLADSQLTAHSRGVGPPAGSCTTAAAASSAQQACVPLEMRCGSSRVHTGPSSRRLQSTITHSERSFSRSVTKLERQRQAEAREYGD